MTFQVGDRVRVNSYHDPYEVVAGPDAAHNYCVRNQSGCLYVRPQLDLSPAPRTLAEVDPGVACREEPNEYPRNAYFRLDDKTVVLMRANGTLTRCAGVPTDWRISEVLGPVKTVIEGREG